jgi:hypothetical protein
MELSKILKYRDSLRFDAVQFAGDELTSELSNLVYKVNQNKHYLNTKTVQDTHKNYKLLLDQIANLKQNFNSIKKELHTSVVKEEPKYFKRSYDIYDSIEMPEYILERSKTNSIYSPSDNKMLIDRARLHTSWKHAGMYIRPCLGEIADVMKPLNPLYIVDTHCDLFGPYKKKFNKAYQQRLRYECIDRTAKQKFKNFPKGQMGFIFISDFFNYTPLEVIKEYLTELYTLLIPGGVILFTYNNTDCPEACINTENFFKTYVPKRLIIPFVEALGFTLLHTTDTGALSWIEIKKEGELTSIRGGESLAKIVDKQ